MEPTPEINKLVHKLEELEKMIMSRAGRGEIITSFDPPEEFHQAVDNVLKEHPELTDPVNARDFLKRTLELVGEPVDTWEKRARLIVAGAVVENSRG